MPVEGRHEPEGRQELSEIGNRMTAGRALRSDELGAVLRSLGPCGDARARLDAVVALLVHGRAASAPEVGGAFAAGPANVTDAFTSGLHNYLRAEPLNAVTLDTVTGTDPTFAA